MNGMRKIGAAPVKKGEENENDELDFDQEIEEAVQIGEIAESQILEAEKENLEKMEEIEKVEIKHTESVTSNIVIDNNILHKNSVRSEVATIEEINKEIKKIPLNFNEDLLLDVKSPSDLEKLDLDLSDALSKDSATENCNYIPLTLANERSIYIKNLDFSVTPEDLEELFKLCGEINRITVLIDKYTGLPKG